ncbi:FliM/FliN family flagellar motor switch protein [Alisedimentitalea sp. MJ-SS2]|uniref:FliM/FliN family flagellar motor C-terminal domain-containing protein n=1 Tax=Aliisedimentitalea sp. MJ-SS2 TaxID=3049795 RepID=UPI00290F5CCD|nr:FliM/FliN family flagellar motor switch protein [Alisedimentitalea sp. MJ-SS2]MDU8929102.1 FliM/FliN family flagellar motor switch protein [Alisedimentitalea sp. MJ-SS2]
MPTTRETAVAEDMGEADRRHVLQRKARTGREEHQARVMTPARALRLALARVADELLDLALSVSSIHVAEAGQDGTIASFREDRMIMVLDGPDGAVGAITVEMTILAGLIEMQTMGQVLPGAPEPRPPTQTDAALAAPLIDGMLTGFAENLGGEEQAVWSRGYRYGAMVEGPRMLGLLLEAPDFHVFRMQIDLCDGAKSGEIMLALPVAAPPIGECPVEAGAGEVDGLACRRTLGQGALMAAQAQMTAELHRLRMPLAEVSELKPGAVLNIPRTALIETRLVAGNGRGAVTCRLGQINGFRAVRMQGMPGALAENIEPGIEMSEAGLEAQMAALPVSDVGRQAGSYNGMAELPDDLDDLDDLIGEAAGAELSGDRDGEIPALEGVEDIPAAGAEDGTADVLPDLPGLDGLGDLADLPDLSLEE